MRSTIVVDWILIILLFGSLLLIHGRLARLEDGMDKWQQFIDVGVRAIK